MNRTPVILTIVLVLMWLLLNNSISAGQLLLGTLLAILLMLAASQLRPIRPRVRCLHLALPLMATVLADVIRSNVAVARIVLGFTRQSQVKSGFINIPLDLTDPHGLAVLAVIITSTPGTAWAGVTDDGRHLRLHVLDLKDEAGWIHTIKDRYERPLMRMFQ